MWQCIQCGETHEDSFDACWKCGASKNRATNSTRHKPTESHDAIHGNDGCTLIASATAWEAKPAIAGSVRTPSLCWFTWFTMILLVATSLGKNGLGQYDFSDNSRFSPVYRYGWPMLYLSRAGAARDTTTDREFSMRERILSFSLVALETNFVVNALIIVGACFSVEHWCRLKSSPPRFTVSVLLAATAWIATGLMMYRARHGEIYYWSMMHDVFDVVVYIAIGLAWAGLFTAIGCAMKTRTASTPDT